MPKTYFWAYTGCVNDAGVSGNTSKLVSSPLTLLIMIILTTFYSGFVGKKNTFWGFVFTKKNVAILLIASFFKVPNHVLFFWHTSTVEYSESDLGEWCQEPANMLGGVPRHPCGIYTPSIHSEQFFGVLGHCPTIKNT